MSEVTAEISRESVLESDALRREWDSLADRAEASPFARPGWVDVWWRAFGRGTLSILTVRREGQLAAVLPVLLRHGVLRSTTNWHTPLFGVLAEDDGAARQLVHEAFARPERRVSLGFLDAATADVDACRAAAEATDRSLVIRSLVSSPYVVIDREWNAYAGTVAGKVVRDLRRRRRRLEEQGALTSHVWEAGDGLEDLLDEGFRIEPSGWKASGRTSIVARPETHRFYVELAKWAAGRDCLRLAFLRLDDAPVAFQYGLEEGGVYYFLKGGYDRAYHRYAPGRLLTQAMLERAFAIGLKRFEFLGGDESWKLEWADSTRELQLVQAFSNSVAGRLDRALLTHGRRLGKRARLDRVVQRLRR